MLSSLSADDCHGRPCVDEDSCDVHPESILCTCNEGLRFNHEWDCVGKLELHLYVHSQVNR